MSNKRKSLCIKEKAIIIRAIKTGRSIGNVSKDFGHSRSTVTTIWKNKDKILQADEDGKSGKKLKKPKYEYLDQAVITWLRSQRQDNIHVSRLTLKAKAEELSKELGLTTFKASEGWLGKFQQRHNIKYGQSTERNGVRLGPRPKQKGDFKEDNVKPTGPICTSCSEEIVGHFLRHICVQCPDYELCGVCEASGAHYHHYVLRVPLMRPNAEVVLLLARIRDQLNQTHHQMNQTENVSSGEVTHSIFGGLQASNAVSSWNGPPALEKAVNENMQVQLKEQDSVISVNQDNEVIDSSVNMNKNELTMDKNAEDMNLLVEQTNNSQSDTENADSEQESEIIIDEVAIKCEPDDSDSDDLLLDSLPEKFETDKSSKEIRFKSNHRRKPHYSESFKINQYIKNKMESLLRQKIEAQFPETSVRKKSTI